MNLSRRRPSSTAGGQTAVAERSRGGRPPRGRRAALSLVVITPLVAEFTLGATPIAMAWLILLYIPIYGFGVLTIRELLRRTGGGPGSTLLMGLVYGLIEEGVALQALTSPHIYHVARWAPRPFGINTAYAELNLAYHAVFSVTIPIVLVDLIFPGLAHRPFLRRRGLIGAGVVALLGVLMLRASVPPKEDPGYDVPTVALLVIVALIAVLSVAALWLLPRSGRPARSQTGALVPSPVTVATACGVATLLYLGLLYPFGGAHRPAFTHGGWTLVPMVVGAVVAVAAWSVIRRWSAAAAWSRRHLLAAAIGALVAHTVFGLAANTHTVANGVGLTAAGVVMCALLALLDRRVRDVPGSGLRAPS
ncbi:hypothetical protein [Actinoallomurus sp. CA-150999]|uniref:hypothetical protein n=1 Tax=Actinoallomurus sp. CA-150999 TaxID=3239887 RepID=UPI003D8EC851